jgi:hypothetical protein
MAFLVVGNVSRPIQEAVVPLDLILKFGAFTLIKILLVN